MRVIMSDEEKKGKFFAGFNPRSAQWNSVKTFWMQSNHTFDDLSRGVQQQHSLDAVEAEDNASGVRSFMTILSEPASRLSGSQGSNPRTGGLQPENWREGTNPV